MSKNSSVFSMIKLGLILAAYAVAACTILAVVNNVTDPIIEQHNIEKRNAMLSGLFPEADSFEEITDYTTSGKKSVSVDGVYLCKKQNRVIGGAVQISGPTYDHATIITGIDLNGTVKGLQFLEISDSPGFGLKANDPTFTLPSGKTFYGQFEGKNAADGFTVGSTFDAISGATITSRGVGELVSEGCSILSAYLKEHNYE